MKKIIIILLFVLILGAGVTIGYQVLKVQDYNKKVDMINEERNNIQKAEAEKEQELENKKKELDELKETKKDLIKEYEVWQEKVKKVKES